MSFIGEVIVGQFYGECEREGSSAMLACNQPVSNVTVQPAINEEKEKCDATDFIGIRVPTNDRDRHVHSQRKRDIDKHAIVRYRRLLKRHRN